MNTHYKEKISPFLDRELGDEERQEVGEHLINCRECREAHDEIREGRRLAAMMKTEDAPPAVWNRINARIRDGEPRRMTGRRYVRPMLAFGAAIVGMLLLVPLYLYIYLPAEVSVDPGRAGSEPALAWRVEEITGDPTITRSGEKLELAVGGVLETDAASSARIAVADIGRVEVAPNSRVKLVRSNEKEHRLALDRGKLSAEIIAPPRLFIVDTPTASAVDLGCAYTLEVADDGSSRLHVTSGYVSLETDGLDSFVPAGAFCETRKGKRLGTPFFGTASDRLKSSLAEFDFGNGSSGALDTVIREAGKKDTLTLWHLLLKAPEARRAEIVARILEFVELNGAVTLDGLLRLDRKMLEELRSDLEPIWYEQPGWFDE